MYILEKKIITAQPYVSFTFFLAEGKASWPFPGQVHLTKQSLEDSTAVLNNKQTYLWPPSKATHRGCRALFQYNDHLSRYMDFYHKDHKVVMLSYLHKNNSCTRFYWQDGLSKACGYWYEIVKSGNNSEYFLQQQFHFHMEMLCLKTVKHWLSFQFTWNLPVPMPYIMVATGAMLTG